MNFSKLENLKKIKKMSYEELAPLVGMSKNGLNLAVKNKDLKVSVLEKIANFFEVPVSYFFDEEPSDKPDSNLLKPCKNCEMLQNLVSSQDSHIKRLESELKKCLDSSSQRRKAS